MKRSKRQLKDMDGSGGPCNTVQHYKGIKQRCYSNNTVSTTVPQSVSEAAEGGKAKEVGRGKAEGEGEAASITQSPSGWKQIRSVRRLIVSYLWPESALGSYLWCEAHPADSNESDQCEDYGHPIVFSEG